MNNTIAMTAEFNRQKNTKASAYTLAVLMAVLLILFLIKVGGPISTPQPAEDIIDINLGNSDVGSGDDQPQLPGEPAPAQQTAYTPPQPDQSAEESARDAEEDNTPDEAPKIIKPNNPKPEAQKINTETKAVKTPNPKPAEVVTPTPTPVVRPKAVLGRTTGGNGNGGNGADTYKPGTGEGQGGGTGDQGQVGGNPNGRNYTGTPKNFGVKVLSIPSQSFEDDFSSNAKIAMIVEVDPAGKVTSATYTSKGSTGTATENMKSIARRRAFELKLGASEGGQKGTVVFNFVVRGG